MIVPKSKLPHKELQEIVCYLGSGISRPFKSDNIGLPVLRSNNVSDGKVNRDNLKYWFQVDPRGTDLCKVKPCKGDILVNFVNGSRKELGKAGLFLGVPKNCIVSTNFFIVRLDKSKACPYFINFFFQSEEYRKWLYQITYFSGQGSFNQQEFKSLKIPVPPLPEQKKIAEILSKWDEGIEKVEKLIAAKKKIKKALCQQLLTGKKRFKEFVTSTEMCKYHFYELPEDWGNLRVTDIAKAITNRHDGSDVIVLSCSKYEGLVNSLDYFGKKVYSNDTSNYKIVKCGQFAYPSNHVEEGSIGLLRHIETGVVSPIYTVFQTNKKAEPEFMYALFKTELYRHIFSVNTNASVDRRGSLRWKEFSNIHVPLPSLPEQKKIASVLNAADKEIELLSDKLEALKNQKKGLMQKLLTGKIRVRVN